MKLELENTDDPRNHKFDEPDQICIFRYMDEGFNFYDVDFFEGRTWRLREKTIFAFMPVASPEGFHRRR